MNAENFNYFWIQSKRMAYVRKIKPEAIDSSLGGVKYDGSTFDRALAETLSKVRVFEVSDNLKKLLAMTDAPKINEEELVRLPYDDIFLDVAFTRDELIDYGITPIYADMLRGIAVTKGNMIWNRGDENVSYDTYESQKRVGNGLRITMCSSIYQTRHEVLFDVFNKNINLDDEYKDKDIEIIENPTSDSKLRDFVHKFVLNFLNFLNNRDVEYVERRTSESNIKRKLKTGKPLIPSVVIIKVSGKIKEYIDDVTKKGLWNFSHRFWVRGHFRDLRDERYKDKKRIFILPFIKGKGLLIEKDYFVDGDK